MVATGALLVLGGARAAQARRGKPAAADQEAQERAREHALKGDAAFRDGHYDEAMTEFGAGYAAVPSGTRDPTGTTPCTGGERCDGAGVCQ